MLHKQEGFTLIELVMVIVILGILAAVALPKLADLSRDAKIASLTTARGAVISAMNIAHSQAVIEGKEMLASSSINLEGITINLIYGYPSIGNNSASSIRDAAGMDRSEFYSVAFGNSTYGLVLVLDSTGSYSTGCGFKYADATVSNPAIVGALPPAYSICK